MLLEDAAALEQYMMLLEDAASLELHKIAARGAAMHERMIIILKGEWNISTVMSHIHNPSLLEFRHD